MASVTILERTTQHALSPHYNTFHPKMFLNFACVELAYSVIFFFFQAEDGIRDYKVTGVQTCALPISPSRDGGSWKAVVHCLPEPVQSLLNLAGGWVAEVQAQRVRSTAVQVKFVTGHERDRKSVV